MKAKLMVAVVVDALLWSAVSLQLQCLWTWLGWDRQACPISTANATQEKLQH